MRFPFCPLKILFSLALSLWRTLNTSGCWNYGIYESGFVEGGGSTHANGTNEISDAQFPGYDGEQSPTRASVVVTRVEVGLGDLSHRVRIGSLYPRTKLHGMFDRQQKRLGAKKCITQNSYRTVLQVLQTGGVGFHARSLQLTVRVHTALYRLVGTSATVRGTVMVVSTDKLVKRSV